MGARAILIRAGFRRGSGWVRPTTKAQEIPGRAGRAGLFSTKFVGTNEDNETGRERESRTEIGNIPARWVRGAVLGVAPTEPNRLLRPALARAGAG